MCGLGGCLWGRPARRRRFERSLGGIGFAARLRAKGPRRPSIVRHCREKIEREPGHRLDTLEVDELHVVAGPVVLVMQPGVEHDSGDSRGDERIMVGVFVDRPVEGEFERLGTRPVVGLHDRSTQPFGRPGPEDLQPLAAEPADHVEVHGKGDRHMSEQRGPHTHEVVGAQQPLFLTIPEGEQDRPPRPARQVLHRLGHFDQSGHTGGIVVGPVVDEAERAIAVAGVAVADVVVVGADHDQFVGDGRIAAAGEGEDVSHAAKLLVVAAIVAGWFEPEFFEVADDVAAGGPTAAAAPFTALESVVGEGADVPLGVFGLNARASRGHQFGGEKSRLRGRHSHAGNGGGTYQPGWNPRDPHDA